MRSEKEIRDRLAIVQKLIDDETKYIHELMEIEEGMNDFISFAMNRGNMYQSEKYHLRWVLGEVD